MQRRMDKQRKRNGISDEEERKDVLHGVAKWRKIAKERKGSSKKAGEGNWSQKGDSERRRLSAN